MYKSLQGSLTQERICWWRYNIFLLQEAQRKIPRTLQSHRSIEFLGQIFVHRHAGARLDQLLQQDKAHTTITVTFISKRSIHNLLQVLLLEGTVQPKAVGHLHRIFRCLHLRRQSLTEAELRVRPSLPSDACGMPGIGTCLEQSAGVALFINRFLIE